MCLRSRHHWCVLAVGLSWRWGGRGSCPFPSPLLVDGGVSFHPLFSVQSAHSSRQRVAPLARKAFIVIYLRFNQNIVVVICDLIVRTLFKTGLFSLFSCYQLFVKISVTNGSNNRPHESWSLSAVYCKYFFLI